LCANCVYGADGTLSALFLCAIRIYGADGTPAGTKLCAIRAYFADGTQQKPDFADGTQNLCTILVNLACIRWVPIFDILNKSFEIKGLQGCF
jgi:hypothetical protein